jgi:hypothetical protein
MVVGSAAGPAEPCGAGLKRENGICVPACGARLENCCDEPGRNKCDYDSITCGYEGKCVDCGGEMGPLCSGVLLLSTSHDLDT